MRICLLTYTRHTCPKDR